MAEFRMPALGADMETGTVVEWRVRPGSTVRSGDVIAVVETHKGAIDVECFLDGVIDELVPVGLALPVGAVLAQVHAPDEPRPALTPVAAVTPATERAAAPPAASAVARPAVLAPPPLPAPPAAGAWSAAPAPRAAAAGLRVTPAARRLAARLALDPADAMPTGADGAVTLADVERAARRRAPRSPAASAAAGGPAAAVVSGQRAVVPGGFDADRMRRAIALAMARSKREIPHYYLWTTIDFTRARDWLEAYNAAQLPAARLLPAVLLLKATALALRAVPQLNGFYEADAFRAADRIHAGWAIALRGGGLVAPAIHDADRLALPELMAALRDLVQRARVGGLRSSELTDPTVTITSLGDRGAEGVLGVVYPPQVAIIGFGRVVTRPWVDGDAVVPRPVIGVSLAADHRASDGHLGGRLLAAIDDALQRPEDMVDRTIPGDDDGRAANP